VRDAAGVATGTRTQDYQRAAAADAISRFNAQNRQDAQNQTFRNRLGIATGQAGVDSADATNRIGITKDIAKGFRSETLMFDIDENAPAEAPAPALPAAPAAAAPAGMLSDPRIAAAMQDPMFKQRLADRMQALAAAQAEGEDRAKRASWGNALMAFGGGDTAGGRIPPRRRAQRAPERAEAAVGDGGRSAAGWRRASAGRARQRPGE